MTNSSSPLASASPALLAKAHRHTARIARKAAGNFYYAFILLPKVQRQGIQALYAFCRAGDDAVDEPNALEARKDLLAHLRRRLDLCYNGYYDDLMTLALADAVQKFRFDRRHFDDLLLGVESDLTSAHFNTLDELWEYCYRVASTVGLLCLPIFNADSEQARAYAVELGLGMQLTNILRDLREDIERGRSYLPSEELAEFGLTADRLFEFENRDKRAQLVIKMAGFARDRFNKAASLLPVEYREALIAARAMGKIYESILDRIEAEPTVVNRIELSHTQKLTIARTLLLGK